MDEMHEVNRKIDRILSYMENDSAMGREGLVQQVNRIDKDVEGIKSREKVYMARVTGAAVAGGALLQCFWFILSKIFKI